MNSMNAIEGSEELNIIHLENALLCANCEMIVSETRNGKCPVCGSGAQLSLSRLLGGTLEHPCRPAAPTKLQVLNGRMEAQASSLASGSQILPARARKIRDLNLLKTRNPTPHNP